MQYIIGCIAFVILARGSMTKIITVEIVLRGDIIEKNVIKKLGMKLRDSNLKADFSSNISVPPYVKASKRNLPSLAVLYGTVEIEDLFLFKSLVEKTCNAEQVEIVSIMEL